MKYQVDYGTGWVDVRPIFPDGNEAVDPEDWFDFLEEKGSAIRARVLSGRQVIAETDFEEEDDDLEEEEEEEEE